MSVGTKVAVLIVGTGTLLVLADTRYAPVAVAFLAATLAYVIIKPKGNLFPKEIA